MKKEIKINKTVKTSINFCPCCECKLSAATGIDKTKRPSSGAVSICYSCTSILIFCDDLSLREATVEEEREIMQNDKIRTLRQVMQRIDRTKFYRE